MEELVISNMKFLEKYVVNFLTYHDRIKTNSLVFDELKKSRTVRELFRKSAKPKITIKDIKFELQV